jgi:hypothetical protein
MGFFYFLVALWTTYFCVVGLSAPPVHGKLEKNLKFHGWAVPVLFDGLSWISPIESGAIHAFENIHVYIECSHR